jgi:uncharacterized protein YozE (UPF0346 family)
MENLLNPDPRTPFEIFANEMYQENCIERESYGEPFLTLDEYIEKNMKFLLDNAPKSVL